MAYRNYSVANGVTVAKDGNGDFTTIAGALAAAQTGQTIFIKTGVYSESLTLVAGVNLSAFECDSSLNGTGNVQITGKLTFTGAGSVTISGIQLNTNSDYFLAVTGSAASVVNLVNCYLNCPDNTGINFTSSSSSSSINISNCNGNLGTDGIAIYSMTSSGTLSFNNCIITNSGSSLAPSSSSDGLVNFSNSTIDTFLFTSSSGVFTANNSYFNFSGASNAITLTAGTSTNYISNCNIKSTAAAAIYVENGTTLGLYNCNIDSPNNPAVDGFGTINLSGISFSDSTTFSGSLTLGTTNGFYPGGNLGSSGYVWTSNGPGNCPTFQAPPSANLPAFTAYLSATQTNVTGDGTVYSVVFDTATTNQGSNYNTGTGLFTAPVTGLYYFNTCISFDAFPSSAATDTIITWNGSAFNFRAVQYDNMGTTTTTPYLQNASVVVPMTQGDTMGINVAVYGTTKTIGVDGNAPSGNSAGCYFAGYLIQASGAISSSTYFSANLSTTQTNATGDGTAFPVVFDNAASNVGSAYNAGTGVFTAPATGFYQFNSTVAYSGIGAAGSTQFILEFSGSAYDIRGSQESPTIASGDISQTASLSIPMTIGDTMSVVATGFNGTKTVSINGGATTGDAFTSVFSGYRVA